MRHKHRYHLWFDQQTGVHFEPGLGVLLSATRSGRLEFDPGTKRTTIVMEANEEEVQAVVDLFAKCGLQLNRHSSYREVMAEHLSLPPTIRDRE